MVEAVEARVTPASGVNLFNSGNSIQFISNYRGTQNPVKPTIPQHIKKSPPQQPPIAQKPLHKSIEQKPRPTLQNQPEPVRPEPKSTDATLANAIRNIVYLNDGQRSEKLDLYLPSTPAPSEGYPVMLAIHGGGWHKNSKEHFIPAVQQLTSDGFAVVAVNYQLATAKSQSWPTAIQDLEQALGWINRQSAKYKLNPEKIAAVGTSAGGHLAMLLATGFDTSSLSSGRPATGIQNTAQNLPKIKAAVSFFGPTELASCAAESQMGAGIAISRFLGGSSTDYPDRYQAASPLNHVSKTTAPILMIHGTADDLIPINQSEKMDYALAAAGVMHQLIVVPGGTHTNLTSRLGYMQKSYQAEVVSFLKKAMNLN